MYKTFYKISKLTENLITNWYNKKTDDVIKMLHNDVIWIGSTKYDFFSGIENVSHALKKIDLTPCKIDEMETKNIFTTKNISIVSGRYIGRTSIESREIVEEMQRFTIVWKAEKDFFKVLHMHISNNLELQEDNENFPHKMGRQTYEYMQRILSSRNIDYEKKIKIKDIYGVSQFFSADKIVYIKANGKYCNINTINGNIKVLKKISEVNTLLPSQFFSPHRSYIVNKNYITGVERFKLRLCNNEVLPIPEKRYSEIKKYLLEIND